MCLNTELITPGRFYTCLFLGILLSAGSLTGKQTPWGYHGYGGNPPTQEVWFNLLSEETCVKDVATIRRILYGPWAVLISASSDIPIPKEICMVLTWDQRKDLTRGDEGCYRAGLASLVLMIIGITFTLFTALSRQLRCEIPNWAHFVFIFLSFSCLVTALAVFHNVCTAGVIMGGIHPKIKGGTYGYAFACAGVCFLTLVLIMHGIIVVNGDDTLKSSAEDETTAVGMSNDNSFNARSSYGQSAAGTFGSGSETPKAEQPSSKPASPRFSEPKPTTPVAAAQPNPFEMMAGSGAQSQTNAVGGGGNAYENNADPFAAPSTGAW